MRRTGILSLLLCLCTVFTLAPISPALAQGKRISFIRDAEIEETLRTFSAPIFDAAGLKKENIDLYIVNDKSLNAFVARGQNIFFNAGLLMKAGTAEEVIGVIAHETGHISGGHLARIGEQLDIANNTSIATFLLSAVAGIAAGRGDVAFGALAAGQHLATQNILGYSRTQERSADQAGIEFLDKAGLSSKGLLTFMKKLESQAFLISDNRDPYLSTHPAVDKRISFIKKHLETSPLADAPVTASFEVLQRRMRGKLKGFLNEPVKTLRDYDPVDTSVEARYARAIAFYRKPDLTPALELIDGLLAEMPADPYFLELKGQVLFENSRIAESVPYYEKAVATKPGSALLRVGLAQSQIAMESKDMSQKALGNLTVALKKEPDNRYAWRLKSQGHANLGNIAMAELSLAEYALLGGDKPQAKLRAQKALKALPENTPSWFRASDIIALTGKNS